MQPMFGLSVFLNEATILPVILQDATGGELTGYVASSVTLTKSLNGAAMTTLTASSWIELGHGLYEMSIAGSAFSAEGVFAYRAATNPAGTHPAFNGFAQIVHRVDQYECWVNPEYDEVTKEFAAHVWLTKNGQIVQAPISCALTLTDVNGVSPVNITSILPDADGVFVLTQSEIVLSLSMAYKCKVVVTNADGTWTSILGALTFN